MMDAGPLVAVPEGSPEGETVCAALARYEATLRDAVREIHVDVSAFKLGVERRLEEALRVSGPLGRAVAQLQQENRQLRGQLEALTRQVEMLTGTVCDRSALLGTGPPQTKVQSGSVGTQPDSSPPAPSLGALTGSASGSAFSPSTTRFSSRATFSVSSKTNSIEREEPIEVDPAPAPSGLENGHTPTAENSTVPLRESPPPIGVSQRNSPPVSMAMPHLPITATTKVADSPVLKGPESPSSSMQSTPSDVTDSQPDGQTDSSDNQPQLESPIHAVSSVKTWTPSPVRTMGSPRLNEKVSTSAPSKSVAYSSYSSLQNQINTDRNVDIPGELSFGRGIERRRELVRSQTLPRSLGAQARRSIFERLDSETNSRPKPVDSKPKLKRSQSFGVSSASSIKQILLEWCRSKTIGYQNIDIQNFSSSWSDGMAFCALVHSFFPTEFDYNALSPVDRKHNFELAFSTAEKHAGCDRLIEVEDMMVMGRKPDPMCVFTYVQSLYNHLRKFE
ncbi:smoothelin, like [Astyanax mexicanus]|uniref:smoothelin, like n=1 Tax=Astyanax mexicanus TaxID=7994 RepID=UPI0020CAD2CC|nr:smoothelin, like [Astyanax mexicanus]XP_007245999.3 smoothelin, like [Astyanax mexicanus]